MLTVFVSCLVSFSFWYLAVFVTSFPAYPLTVTVNVIVACSFESSVNEYPASRSDFLILFVDPFLVRIISPDNSELSGILSSIVTLPVAVPLFSAVIVYVIVSPYSTFSS